LSSPAARIVFEDERMAVVDKPAGLVVHPASGHHGDTLVDLLGELLGGGEDPRRPGIVHRLDKDTSGLMIVARDDESHRRLAAQIKAREVGRTYLALVDGTPRSRSGTIDAPLGRDYRAPARRAVGGRSPRTAVTHFEVTEPLAHDALLKVRLETGRTHQIRAHLASIGHPVVGDPRYGGPRRYGLERQFLHSSHLELRHPITAEKLRFDSELPADLAAALALARDAE
jgi:23S rRNA pseudouridine1911/1915/1917 synthase